jgi:hypothetical protein
MEKKDAMLIWQRLKKEVKPITKERRIAIVARLKKCEHKPEVDPNDWDRVHYNLLLVAEFDLNLCEALGLPFVVSSIIRPGIPGVSVSKTHEQGRAYDRSVKNWSKKIIPWFVELINDGLRVGAISLSDGKEREALYEPTEIDPKTKKIKKTEHMHFQCSA